MVYSSDNISFGGIKGLRLTSPVLMDRATGKSILDFQHLKNSIVDILTTRLGSRVMLRDYGTRLFQLIDRPINRDLILELRSIVFTTLRKWEPRLYITRVDPDLTNWQAGQLGLNIDGYYLVENGPVRIEDLSLNFMVQNTYEITDPRRYEETYGVRSFADIAADVPDTLILTGVGDIGIANATQTAQVSLMNSFAADYLLLPGDLNYEDGSATTIFQNTAAFNDAIINGRAFPAIGNHENAGGGNLTPHLQRYPYLPGNQRYYKQVLWGGLLTLFVINTGYTTSGNPTLEPDGNTVGSIQHQWLVNELAKCNSPYVMLMGHHPFASQVTSGAGETHVQLGWIKELPKVQLYFHGHTHTGQHNIYAPNGVLKMHVLDVSAGARPGRAMSSSGTMYGDAVGMQNVWAYASAGNAGPPVVTKFTLTRRAMLVEVYNVDTGLPMHSFNIYPWT